MTSGLKLELQTDFFKLQLPEVPSSLVVVLNKLVRSRLNRNTPFNPHGPNCGTGRGCKWDVEDYSHRVAANDTPRHYWYITWHRWANYRPYRHLDRTDSDVTCTERTFH